MLRILSPKGMFRDFRSWPWRQNVLALVAAVAASLLILYRL